MRPILQMAAQLAAPRVLPLPRLFALFRASGIRRTARRMHHECALTAETCRAQECLSDERAATKSLVQRAPLVASFPWLGTLSCDR
jgi:hypothetical protein